jgi:eukaryotic-like serine/threonine-protein kinase
MAVGSPGSALLPDGYEFVRMLGHGSSGWVALARQVQLDRLVAIKAIHAGGHDRAGQRRLEREGRAVVALRHRAIVAVYELRQTTGGAALVMEYVPGGDLRTLMDSGNLTGSHAAALLGEIAAALSHAHAAGIIHRDVKPANVLLTADGHAKVADFGLARLTRTPEAVRTSTAGVSGTPAYMAPEQILDPSSELPAIDTYAFAVLAYELLSGARPYPARGVAGVIAAHLNDIPPPPWQVAPGHDDRVGRILLAGLAKHPQERPSPAQIADEIVRVTSAEWDAYFRTRMPPVRSVPGSDVTSSRADGTIGGPSAPPREPLIAPAPAHVYGVSRSAPAPALGNPGRANAARARAWRAAVVLGFALAGSALGLVLVLIARRL